MASDALIYLLPSAHFVWNRLVDLAGLFQCPPWYAYPLAAGIAVRCLIWLWQYRKHPLPRIKRLQLPTQELRR